jgi:hypothetical protein
MRRFGFIPIILVLLTACGPSEDAADSADMPANDASLATDAQASADAAGASALACAPTADAAGLAERPSPYDSVSLSVGSGHAKICYSRPQLRGRTMIGGDAVPYGRLWRFGANEPTIIHVSAPASIAGVNVEPGSYSLYTVPQEGAEWTLIVNASTSQWGHENQYTPEVEAQEVARTPIRAESVATPVESFTIRPAPDGSGIVAEWQNSRVHIPITAR